MEIQISITKLRLPVGVTLTSALVQDLVRHKAETGDDLAGTTQILRWKNPARVGAKRNWRQGNQGDAWETLRKWLMRGAAPRIRVRKTR